MIKEQFIHKDRFSIFVKVSHEFHISSPLGNLKLTASVLGIQSLRFVDHELIEKPVSSEKAPLVAKLQKQMNEYFEGKRTKFELPLDLKGTEFQIKVWNLLQSVPHGTTITYLQLAEKYGERNAIRAIAAASAKNKIAIIIPCHRVIGTDGSLTGYAWGLNRKRILLEHEGGLAKQSQLDLK